MQLWVDNCLSRKIRLFRGPGSLWARLQLSRLPSLFPLTWGICSLCSHIPARLRRALPATKKDRMLKQAWHPVFSVAGGEGGIRTPGTVNPYVSLANWWFQPLTHLTKRLWTAKINNNSQTPNKNVPNRQKAVRNVLFRKAGAGMFKPPVSLGNYFANSMSVSARLASLGSASQAFLRATCDSRLSPRRL